MTSAPRWAAAMHRATTYLSQDLFGGPRPWSLAALIDFQKGGTFAFLGVLMWWYGNQSVAAWTYVAMHGSYGLVWLLKDVALRQIFRGVWIFVAALTVALAVVLEFQWLSLWLPSFMK